MAWTPWNNHLDLDGKSCHMHLHKSVSACSSYFYVRFVLKWVSNEIKNKTYRKLIILLELYVIVQKKSGIKLLWLCPATIDFFFLVGIIEKKKEFLPWVVKFLAWWHHGYTILSYSLMSRYILKVVVKNS